MKTIRLSHALVVLCLLLTAIACRKSVTDINDSDKQASTRPAPGLHDTTSKPTLVDSSTLPPPFPQSTPGSGCSVLPIYGDTIIYPQPSGNQDYIFNPVNSPGTGTYFAWPQGMTIDPHTGSIDITKSETGLRYAIGFVKAGTTDTCLSTLIIGGAAYMDSVYVLQDGEKNAIPYFDANPYLPSICDGSQGPDKCKFDIYGGASFQKIIIDKQTGQIDLDKTLNGKGLLGGAFGPLPFNGQIVNTRIYYQLKDKSNKTLEYIDLRLQYFDKRSDIPPGLLDNIFTNLGNLLGGNLISQSANPRPPLIIIVRRNIN